MTMTKRRTIRIVIADDHAILRSGLRLLLGAQPDMKVVGEAESGDQALEQVRSLKPDILLLDISMPGTDGIETATQVTHSSRTCRVVVLTMHTEAAYFEAALAAGVSGYVLKKALDSDLVSAIRSAHEGKTFIDSGVAAHLVKKALGHAAASVIAAGSTLEYLSRRERQVLRLIAEGYTNAQIAEQVFIGIKSVETYRGRLLKKLGLRTRREIVRFAIDNGLLATH